MDVKYNIQDLAEWMAHKNKMSRKDAEIFVRTFFEVISTFLLHDKIVKVKGLGTFKLVVVSDRESIDVNTGRRITISGHSKVSFTPDSSLKDLVNKPFLDFETVILNDDTDTEEMERIPSLHEEELTEGETSDLDVLEESSDTKTMVSNVGENEEEEKQNPVDEVNPQGAYYENNCVENYHEDKSEVESLDANDIIEDETPEPEIIEVEEHTKEVDTFTSDAEDEKIPEIKDLTQNESHDVVGQTTNSTFDRIRCLRYACMLFLVVGSYFLGYYRLLCPCGVLPDNLMEDENESPAVLVAEDSVQKDVPSVLDTTKAVVKEEKVERVVKLPKEQMEEPVTEKTERVADVEQYPQIPGGEYLIVGTKGVHVMKRGDNLYKIARTTYGHNDFVKYIIVYNQFKNPDVIPPGYSIRLPELKEVR